MATRARPINRICAAFGEPRISHNCRTRARKKTIRAAESGRNMACWIQSTPIGSKHAPAEARGACALGAGFTGVLQRRARVRAPTCRSARVISMDQPGQGIYDPATRPQDVNVVVFGSTGYIGKYVTKEFIKQGYRVTAFARPSSGIGGKKTMQDVRDDFEGGDVRFGDVTDLESVKAAFENLPDAKSTIVVSCLASRGGGIKDSNLIDYQATLNTLRAGREAGASHFILLSAICVQKPLLEFQRAKLKFEAELSKEAERDQDFSFSIVRPTAFFKSLAGQFERLGQGNAYIYFGDGKLCKCNAISESDLAKFMVLCAHQEEKRNSILPVGGPGEPVTPLEQAELQFALLGKKPKYSSAPIALFDVIINVLDTMGRLIPPLREAAEFGRIGKYYATEDMVGPSFGEDTLEAFFVQARDGGLSGQELGDASIFNRKEQMSAGKK
ncbi:Divinyl chlorophyllide a 8-vinyl-reductase, chloroplastic [Porphyridium purpureum]|uniref:Divinyl chlorophyllide a 8-vinyl-reductase, chloroplastic n=1 Tax=Porphyridium purpureum TaxID=35688 RepID=A0A5J4YY95_PORPP|nr:Divinyl chlorophyllide a 8-vinyl-reductase, chloroplastic [Porphyridium purpureum]|eukprot:POR1683..scf209_3